MMEIMEEMLQVVGLNIGKALEYIQELIKLA